MKKALDKDPGDANLPVILGNLSVLKRDADSALTWYDRALETNPKSVDAHLKKGSLLFAMGRQEEGEKEYRKAIGLSDDEEGIRLLLSRVFLNMRKLGDAEKELDYLIKEMGSQKARRALTEIKIETGKLDEAKELLHEIFKENLKD
ncbi:MAG: hypothetical protein GTO08_01795, partial [Deltaproteobacteria bacterium]|nr:hypothetical protein [Deltaproteobacteria bacterium]